MGLARSLTLVAGLALAGCASTQSLVQTRFQALHGCPADVVHRTAGGFVAIGCGVRAHFVCFDTDDDDDDSLIGDLVFDPMFERDDVCIQEQVDRGPEHVAPRDPTEVSKTKDGAVRLRASVPLMSEPRGGLYLMAAPTFKDPAVAIRMSLELNEPLADKCSARVWADGVSSPVAYVKRESDATVLLAVTSDQLAQLARASTAALEACGQLAKLDLGALPRIRLFERRFAEARARLLPAASAARAR